MKSIYKRFAKRALFTIFIIHLTFFSFAATYYISTTGNNANNGSQGSPWRTLSYACTKAITSGDVIHVNAGTYIETSVSNLAVGVSIEGEGITSIIKSNVGGTSFTIQLSSASQNTNGNQYISNIKMDGDALTGYGAIRIINRGNVKIHNCTFVDFNVFGVDFLTTTSPPTTYVTGNEFHDNIVTNCSAYVGTYPNGDSSGAISINGQDGLLIYNNTITQNRAGGLNGNIIDAVPGYLKNVKIYNNTMLKTHAFGVTWDFAIEFWNCLGGVEVYNNVINGSIDIAGQNNNKGSSTYSVWVHDNTIGQTTLLPYEDVYGVLIESTSEDVIVEKNYIKNVAHGIYFSQVQSARNVKNIRISYNVLYNIGVSEAGSDYKGWGIHWAQGPYYNHTVDNINIWNNTITGSNSTKSCMWGIQVPAIGTATNISIRNNIVKDFDYAPIYGIQPASATINVLSVEKNIIHNNGNSNTPLYANGLNPTNNTTQNNLISDPIFVSSSDYQLKSTSPAINAGVDVGLKIDYKGNSIVGMPDIGAFEYGSATSDGIAPVVTGFTIPTSSTSLTVSLLTLTATDNVGVTGYLLSETSTTPSSAASGWSATKPTTYVFTSVGSKSLYAWAKDAAGNVSLSLKATIVISSPVASTFTFTGPSSGNVNSASSNFTVTPNNPYTGTITITPSGTGSTGLSSVVLNFSNSSTAQTFKITPSVAGTVLLTPSNAGSLSNPASLSYSSLAVVPDAPTSVVAIAGNASASVSFVAPANNGGSAITGYTVTSSPAGGVDANAGSTSLTRTITGLTNGTFYTFTVKATNSAGASAASLPSNSVKPVAPSDNTAPVISSFLMPTSATSLTVSITAFNASDNIGISGYLLTEAPTVPSSSATGWTTTAPASYSFSSAGINSVYGWVKDAAGNVSSSAMQTVTITLETKQGELKPSHFIPVWNGENGQNHMNFIVVSAIHEDMPLTADDEIGLFSGNTCVGAQILSKEINSADNSTYLTIQASQNDGSDNGFNNNDSIIVRIWDNSANAELFAKAVVYRNDMPTWTTSGKYSAGATAVIEIVSYIEYTQTIELKKGYNLISTNVTSDNTLACHITQPLVDQGNLIKVQDEAGNSLEDWGSFGGWVNNIGTIKVTEGYKIKVADNCSLQVTGRFVALPLDISLMNGWNIISFPRTDMVDAMAVVQSLIDQGKLVKVQDEAGNSIENWGIYGGWKNGIGNFIPGKAYKIKMNADATLTIHENYLKSSVIFAQAEATSYYRTKTEGNGTDHMNINIVGLLEAGVSVGDELAAFDGKICVGTLKITASHLNTGTACLVASSADDKGLVGFKSGNKIQVYSWNQVTGNETEVQTEVVKGQLNYEINGSVMVKLKPASINVDVIDEFVKIDVFPNPSSGRVTVRFSEMPDAGSKIEITDTAGRMISSRLISDISEEFNLDQQSGGLYLVKTILGSNTTIHKLVIRK